MMQPDLKDINEIIGPPFHHRLFALIYDGFLVFSYAFMIVAVLTMIGVGDHLMENRLLLQGVLLIANYLFFGYFWTRRGQTLGMVAWRMQLVDIHGEPITWHRALIRYFWMLLSFTFFMLGTWFALIDKDNQTLQDRLSKTRMKALPKIERKKKTKSSTT